MNIGIQDTVYICLGVLNTGIQETKYTLPYLTLHTELFIKDENEHFDSGNVKSYIKMNKGLFKIQKCIFYYLKELDGTEINLIVQHFPFI